MWSHISHHGSTGPPWKSLFFFLETWKWLCIVKLMVVTWVLDVGVNWYLTAMPAALTQLFKWEHTHTHTRCNVFKALIMVYCRLTSISLPPALFRFSLYQTFLVSCWEKSPDSFHHSFASFYIIYHGESCCLLWDDSKSCWNSGAQMLYIHIHCYIYWFELSTVCLRAPLCCRRWRRESSISIHSCETENECLSGRCWTDRDHKDTHRPRESEWASFWVQSLHTQSKSNASSYWERRGGGRSWGRDILWCYCLRNLARSRPITHNQTPGGAVSVTRTHTHTPMVTGNPGATWVLS